MYLLVVAQTASVLVVLLSLFPNVYPLFLTSLQEVESSTAQAYADEIGAMFVETSAKDDTHVQGMFVELSKRLPKREVAPPPSGDTLNLDSSGASSSCC